MATFFGFSAIFMWGMLAALSVFTNNIPAFQLLFVCFFIASSLVAIKRLIKRERVFKGPTMNKAQWFMGVSGLFGFHIFYFLALRYAPPIEASLIIYLWPLLLGILVAPKNHKGFALLGGLIGFSGTAMLITNGLEESQITNNTAYIGYIFAGFCALIWAIYSWFLSGTASEVEDIAWVSIVVSMIALICHMAFETPYWDWTLQELLVVLLLGVGPTGGAFYLWDIGMKRGNRSILASISFGTPIIASLALYAFGFSELTITVVLAAVLIVFGAFVSNIGAIKKRKA